MGNGMGTRNGARQRDRTARVRDAKPRTAPCGAAARWGHRALPQRDRMTMGPAGVGPRNGTRARGGAAQGEHCDEGHKICGEKPVSFCCCRPFFSLVESTETVRSVAQPGSASALGAECRGFKSHHSDQFLRTQTEWLFALREVRYMKHRFHVVFSPHRDGVEDNWSGIRGGFVL